MPTFPESLIWLGSFVEMHRNLSMEKYGHADSLDFERISFCWGYFAESEESNALTLDTCLGGMRLTLATGFERHTGSTFCPLDLNGDTLTDLLLGDVDYPNLVALYNDGTAEPARIGGYDWEYPTGTQKVNLFSMPAAFFEDVDGDGRRDLLVSPFDPNPVISANRESSWYYRNAGEGDAPVFELLTRAFLQRDMIDVGAGAYPVLRDFDDDGLSDLFIGNYGDYDSSFLDENLILRTIHTPRIALLRHSGSGPDPEFTWIDDDFGAISANGAGPGRIPAFADLDGDGDDDMVTGTADGKLDLYLNQAPEGAPMQPVFSQSGFLGIDAGSHSAPVFFDLDNDGLDDLILGEQAGNLNYYRNTGSTSNPGFSFVTDSLGKINVTDFQVSLDGFSVPAFFRDPGGRTHLVVGSESGRIFYFTGIDDNLEGAFEDSDTLAGLIGTAPFDTDRGYRSSAALGDIDGDGYPELIAGNFSGGLEYFSRNNGPGVQGITGEGPSRLLQIFPNPFTGPFTLLTQGPEAQQLNSVVVFSADGRQIYNSGTINGRRIIIDGSAWNAGIYLLKARLHNLFNKQFEEVQLKVIKVF